jgi:hypothetical protein
MLLKPLICGEGDGNVGKNLQATECTECEDGLCYYGAKICNECLPLLFRNYQLESVEGYAVNMTFEEWLEKGVSEEE